MKGFITTFSSETSDLVALVNYSTKTYGFSVCRYFTLMKLRMPFELAYVPRHKLDEPGTDLPALSSAAASNVAFQVGFCYRKNPMYENMKPMPNNFDVGIPEPSRTEISQYFAYNAGRIFLSFHDHSQLNLILGRENYFRQMKMWGVTDPGFFLTVLDQNPFLI